MEQDDPKRSVCVLNSESAFADLAHDLACKLDLPLGSGVSESPFHTHALVIVPYRLENIATHAIAIQTLGGYQPSTSRSRNATRRPPKKRTPMAHPFYVDFLPRIDTRLGKRYNGKSGVDLLLKAVSPGKGRAVVLDLTAGFGQDSLILAQGGASRVHMVERDPIVATLLGDALRRLDLVAQQEHHPEYQRAFNLSGKLSLQVGDGRDVAARISSEPDAEVVPDVCYLDPMFPPRTKSAAVKKNMQILHGLLDSQAETSGSESDLLVAAFDAAGSRVVVKRPVKAPPFGADSPAMKPAYTICGTVNRWDVYLKQS